MKLLAVFAIFIVLTYVSASILPAIYDGPTYELGKYSKKKRSETLNSNVTFLIEEF